MRNFIVGSQVTCLCLHAKFLTGHTEGVRPSVLKGQHVCYSRNAEAKKKCRKEVFPNCLMVSWFLLAKKLKFN